MVVVRMEKVEENQYTAEVEVVRPIWHVWLDRVRYWRWDVPKTQRETVPVRQTVYRNPPVDRSEP